VFFGVGGWGQRETINLREAKRHENELPGSNTQEVREKKKRGGETRGLLRSAGCLNYTWGVTVFERFKMKAKWKKESGRAKTRRGGRPRF